MESPIDKIKSQLNIVDVVKDYVKLEKAGINYRGLCPFHSEKTPSFFVSPSRQIWHCFGGCGEGGDMFKFIMKIEGVEFGDALRVLADKAGVTLRPQSAEMRAWKTERERLYEICELTSKFFEKQLSGEPKEYLIKRGITEESIEEWRLGYAPETWDSLISFLSGRGYRKEEMLRAGVAVKKEGTENYFDKFRGRVIFPIFNINSYPIGFGGRILKDSKKEAKYLNSPATPLYDKSKTLYGIDKAKIDIRREDFFVLVEGYTDVIMSHQAGIKNVIATSGTALTNPQLDVLKRYSDNAFIGFDMDSAGDSATKRGIDLARERGFDIKVITLSEGEDPADLILKNPNDWKEKIKNAKSIVQFYFESAFSKFDSSTPEGKRKIGQELASIIKNIQSEIEKDFWIKELAKKLGVNEKAILDDILKERSDDTSQLKKEDKELKPAKKGRREMIEERILIILSADKKLVSKVSDYQNYFLQENRNILEKIINNEEKSSEELEERINLLGMRAEIELDGLNIEEELENCLEELKSSTIKKRMEQLTEELKSIEKKENQEELEKLKKEFNDLIEKLES